MRFWPRRTRSLMAATTVMAIMSFGVIACGASTPATGTEAGSPTAAVAETPGVGGVGPVVTSTPASSLATPTPTAQQSGSSPLGTPTAGSIDAQINNLRQMESQLQNQVQSGADLQQTLSTMATMTAAMHNITSSLMNEQQASAAQLQFYFGAMTEIMDDMTESIANVQNMPHDLQLQMYQTMNRMTGVMNFLYVHGDQLMAEQRQQALSTLDQVQGDFNNMMQSMHEAAPQFTTSQQQGWIQEMGQMMGQMDVMMGPMMGPGSGPYYGPGHMMGPDGEPYGPGHMMGPDGGPYSGPEITPGLIPSPTAG